MTNPSEGWTRVPAILSFPDTPGFTETYGFAGASGKVWLEGQYLIPRERPSKTLYLFMHPSSTLQLLPMPAALVGAGLHVLCAASRYPKNDSGLIIEKVAIDMGAWIKDARSRGYERRWHRQQLQSARGVHEQIERLRWSLVRDQILAFKPHFSRGASKSVGLGEAGRIGEA